MRMLNGSNNTFQTTTNTSIQQNVSSHQQQQQQQNLTNYLQTQFELSLEFRKFINIDLFQRGYYQIRASCKLLNKQLPFKIDTELLNNKNNENLSDSMYPSCLYEDYAVSKTFLILYRNEEIILDDHILFKLTTLVNVLNLLDSFQKLDLNLNIELWFTENDYKLDKISSMQLLCSRLFKLHFDPRFGIHLQVPILFDYFHLSSVTTTIHCNLLTLLPPMMNFTGLNQNNTTLSTILFGKDISKIYSNEITSSLMKRASSVHNSICNLLLIAYENLQEHIKIIRNLLPIDKQFAFNPVNCQEKYKNICEIIDECSDPETLDDLASRYIAQCSAENICLWCTYLDNFILNDNVSAHLALEYHTKRLKRFAESFFTRELSIKQLFESIENFSGENFTQLYDLVKQSTYYAQVPKLLLECIDLDGNYDQIPVIFEENYTSNDLLDTQNSIKKVIKLSSSSSGSESSYKSSLSKNNSNQSNSLIMCIKPFKNQCLNDDDTFSKSSKQKASKTTGSSSSTSGSSTGDLNGSSYTLSGKKNRRKSKGNDSVLPQENGNSIQLVSYRKTLNEENETSNFNRQSSTSSRSSNSDTTNNMAIRINGNKYGSTSSSEFTHEIQVNERAIDVDIDDVLITDKKSLNSPVLTADYSSKSKVLYESFRGKTNTLDRRRVKNLNNVFDQAAKTTTSKTSTPIRVNTIVDSIMLKPGLLEEELKLKNHFDVNRSQSFMDFSTKITEPATQDTRFMSTRSSIAVLKNSLTPAIDDEVYKFVIAKENLKHSLLKKYSGNIYSEFSSLYCASTPYFYAELSPQIPLNLYTPNYSNGMSSTMSTQEEKLHLIICVHGLDGNSGDLRLVRTYLELALPGARMEFLMSEHNQNSTFDDIETMTKQLIKEINDYIEAYALQPDRISFIGHSLGNLIIRSTVAHPDFQPWTKRLYTYLSLSGPHLGTLYNSSGLINMGMWIMQKWKKSGSLLQLSLKDNPDPQKCFLYELSKKPSLQNFKNILLVASPQDRYVPYHSARIDMCKAALKDSIYGNIYKQMFINLMKPIVDNPRINFIRYTVFHTLPSGTSNFIGRAAHIANLDSELFVEKLVLVSAAKYFR